MVLRHPHLHPQLVAWDHATPETNLVEASQHEQAAPVTDYAERQDRCGLR
jgi:hypothetical protein